MALFVISDLHLSTNEKTNKSMEVFGHRWQDYMQKIERNWRAVITDNDTVIIPGDISWALTAEEAISDFMFLENLPGHKIIGKGNHDFWWQTMRKMTDFCEKNHFKTFSFLYNNAFETDEYIICGTRGWYYDASCEGIPKETDFEKICAREAGRLRMSLECGKKLQSENEQKEMLVFLHFPVIWNGKTAEPILSLLHEYGIRDCYFGHIHSAYDLPCLTEVSDIRFHMVSADFLNFVPKLIKK